MPSPNPFIRSERWHFRSGPPSYLIAILAALTGLSVLCLDIACSDRSGDHARGAHWPSADAPAEQGYADPEHPRIIPRKYPQPSEPLPSKENE